MAKVYQFNPQIYPRLLWITIGTKRFDSLFGDVDDEVPESAYAQVDRVYEKKTNLGGVLIRFSSLESMTAGNITHESVHAADCILDYVGAKTDVINDEYLAYLAGWIADCCDKVKEKEINRQKKK